MTMAKKYTFTFLPTGSFNYTLAKTSSDICLNPRIHMGCDTDVQHMNVIFEAMFQSTHPHRMRQSQIDADFGLYKNQRDQYDALQAKYCDLDKKVAIMEALTPYKEKLMMAYVNEKCCRKIDGVLGLQSTPTVTVLPSANFCGCAATSTPTTGA